MLVAYPAMVPCLLHLALLSSLLATRASLLYLFKTGPDYQLRPFKGFAVTGGIGPLPNGTRERDSSHPGVSPEYLSSFTHSHSTQQWVEAAMQPVSIRKQVVDSLHVLHNMVEFSQSSQHLTICILIF